LSLLSLYNLFLSTMTVVLTRLDLKHYPKSLLRAMESYTRSIRRDTKDHRDLCRRQLLPGKQPKDLSVIGL
jgi:hypothetical protein